jgi:L,D-peptidoglycan transpeptidase YkuD (ErfK/YbiS/YcfS/YnhG family)
MDDNIIRVFPNGQEKSKGRIVWRGVEYLCTLGEGGVLSPHEKVEGDGATPFGLFALRCLYIRADKLHLPKTKFTINIIHPNDGWCDDSNDQHYNKHITLPTTSSHEALFREDDLYNVIIPLGYNDGPITPGLGSAIFFHIAQEELAPTKGCVAIAQNSMLEILKTLGPDCLLRVYKSPNP